MRSSSFGESGWRWAEKYVCTYGFSPISELRGKTGPKDLIITLLSVQAIRENTQREKYQWLQAVQDRLHDGLIYSPYARSFSSKGRSQHGLPVSDNQKKAGQDEGRTEQVPMGKAQKKEIVHTHLVLLVSV